MRIDVEQDNFLLRHSNRQCQSIRIGNAHRVQSFQWPFECVQSEVRLKGVGLQTSQTDFSELLQGVWRVQDGLA